MSESKDRRPADQRRTPSASICERCGHEIRQASGFGWFHSSGAHPSPDHAAKPTTS